MTDKEWLIEAWDRINGWSKAVFQEPDQTHGWADGMRKAGYERWTSTGPDEDLEFEPIGFLIYKHSDGHYLIELSAAGMISIPDYPSVLEWLRLYAPVALLSIAIDVKRQINFLYDVLTDERDGVLGDRLRQMRIRRQMIEDYYREKRQAKQGGGDKQ